MRIFQIINILDQIIQDHFELGIEQRSSIIGDDDIDIFSKTYFSINAPKMVLTVVHSYKDKTFKVCLELPTHDGIVYASYVTIFASIEEIRRYDLERIIKDFCRNNSNYIKINNTKTNSSLSKKEKDSVHSKKTEEKVRRNPYDSDDIFEQARIWMDW